VEKIRNGFKDAFDKRKESKDDPLATTLQEDSNEDESTLQVSESASTLGQ